MVNYGAAFKLPFTNIGRSATLFLISGLASLANTSYQIVRKLATQGAVQDSSQTLLILSVWFISILLALVFYSVISGYSIRTAANAIRGRNELPPFDKVPSLIGTGLQYFAAILIYSLPVIIFGLLIAVALAINSLILLMFAAVIGGIAVILWFLLMLYAGPLLMSNFACEKRFAAFFDVRKILKYSFTSAYFVPWIVALGYTIGISIPYTIVAVFVSLLARISPFATLFLVPLAGLYTVFATPAVTNLYGQAYHDVVVGKRAETKPATAAAAGKAKRSASKK